MISIQSRWQTARFQLASTWIFVCWSHLCGFVVWRTGQVRLGIAELFALKLYIADTAFAIVIYVLTNILYFKTVRTRNNLARGCSSRFKLMHAQKCCFPNCRASRRLSSKQADENLHLNGVVRCPTTRLHCLRLTCGSQQDISYDFYTHPPMRAVS